jgi:hypothetical protein
MPPRVSSATDDSSLTGPPINPADAAAMGQNSNGNKRPRDEEDELDDDEDEEGGKKERIPSNEIFLTF